LILQILLGIATFRLHLQVEPLTVSHQAIGAALLGTLVSFTVLALRDREALVQADRAAFEEMKPFPQVDATNT
jgi:heme A synthase